MTNDADEIRTGERCSACGSDPKAFEPGTYVHHKGGHYAALGLVRDHRTGRELVRYVALRQATRGMPHRGEEVRELEPRAGCDAWNDPVRWPDGQVRSRFMPLWEMPELVPLEAQAAYGGAAGDGGKAQEAVLRDDEARLQELERKAHEPLDFGPLVDRLAALERYVARSSRERFPLNFLGRPWRIFDPWPPGPIGVVGEDIPKGGEGRVELDAVALRRGELNGGPCAVCSGDMRIVVEQDSITGFCRSETCGLFGKPIDLLAEAEALPGVSREDLREMVSESLAKHRAAGTLGPDEVRLPPHCNGGDCKRALLHGDDGSGPCACTCAGCWAYATRVEVVAALRRVALPKTAPPPAPAPMPPVVHVPRVPAADEPAAPPPRPRCSDDFPF